MPKDACRQKQNRPQQRKYGIERNPDEAKWYGQQPDQGPKDEGQDGHRPAQDQQDTP
jgi:hypothetical protein